MGLQELLRRVLVHLGRYDAEKIVLDTDHIDCREFIVLDDDLQSPCKLLCFTAFPVKSLAYCDVVKFKCRLGKESRRGLFLEKKFVIESAVIVNLALAVGCDARASPVRLHQKLNPFR